MTSAAINGWLVLDKPLGLSSAAAVARVRRLTGVPRVGHGGTLDPLATGVLPVALGEATKTAGFTMAFRKRYRFSVAWGEARSTDDREGEVTARSAYRPSPAEIEAALPTFRGSIAQRPPAYSAIKVAGRRAYALARAGDPPELAARPVEVFALEITAAAPDRATFEVACGKGFYVRSLARDLALALGTVGHVADLRRLAVGPFREERAIALDSLEGLVHSARLVEVLEPLETALDDIPALAVSGLDAARLSHGQRIAATPAMSDGLVVAISEGRPVAVAKVDHGRVVPLRVFNL
jgi:tRNA pseudouridine55 synthase